MTYRNLLLVAAAALSLGACQGMSPHENRVLGGAAIGGAGGAVVGGVVTGDAGGALVGGAIGATAGALIADANHPWHHSHGRCYLNDDNGARHWRHCPSN